ncbi:MAG: hypothetical protein ABIA08_01820 [bacterium]
MDIAIDMKEIKKDTILSEIIKNTKAQEILVKYKLPCLGCAFAHMEMDKLKIGEVCEMYGLDIKGLLKELNKLK